MQQQILAGPILKRMSTTELTMWFVSTQPCTVKLELTPDTGSNIFFELGKNQHSMIKLGQCIYIHLLHVKLQTALPVNQWIGYQLYFTQANNQQALLLTQLVSDLCYPNRLTPGFVIRSTLHKILHGSCRKPHHAGSDGLVIADKYLADNQSIEQWPSLLMMSGDQIYADDVATPMLVAIHSVISRLGIKNERFDQAMVNDSETLHATQPMYNQRVALLPNDQGSQKLRIPLFKSAEKPVFTTVHANNHLVSFAEVVSMYLLCWSPELWKLADLSIPNNIDSQLHASYQHELDLITEFSKGLVKVRRVMAHLPSAMIFDDHDITDDWNLTADWESKAYGHVFSRRIIGNALLAYLLFQGWGNAPDNFNHEFMSKVQHGIDKLGTEKHDELITTLLKFEHWHYEWPTNPKLIVLDTRTQRWWSETNVNKPSGLMDWESLSQLQQMLIDEQAVVLVSPAPIFGVKLIEAIQSIFTRIGKPLVVDAENWMAHPGSANYLLNVFTHRQTPQNFVILSGDVHYSFAYKIKLKRRTNSPDIWQITSSGLRNTFPESLLNWLDRLNRWLFAPYSPLNLFTKRRNMRISPLKPDQCSKGERLVNGSGIGLVELDITGKPIKISQLLDRQKIRFESE
ncbi:MAG: alkaline phosphatase family protein [Paraglaciecola sp.]|nr:alkaline phosphatase family protein [Paraglaciecola sp.]